MFVASVLAGQSRALYRNVDFARSYRDISAKIDLKATRRQSYRHHTSAASCSLPPSPAFS